MLLDMEVGGVELASLLETLPIEDVDGRVRQGGTSMGNRRKKIVFLVVLGGATQALAVDNSDLSTPNAVAFGRYSVSKAWNCTAGNKYTCDDTFTFSVPGGYQMCKLIFAGDINNEAHLELIASDQFVGDKESPDRFRKFIGIIHAAGGQRRLLRNHR